VHKVKAIKQHNRHNKLLKKLAYNYIITITHKQYIKKKNLCHTTNLTSADPRRYASAEFLILPSDSRRCADPDVFTGSSAVFFSVEDFFTSICSKMKEQA